MNFLQIWDHFVLIITYILFILRRLIGLQSVNIEHNITELAAQLAHITDSSKREIMIVAALADPVAGANMRSLARLRILARLARTTEFER